MSLRISMSTQHTFECLIKDHILINVPYRVSHNGMPFSRRLKMIEKRNLLVKTMLNYYQDHPPFHFIAFNFIKIFNKCSNLTHVGLQDSAEEFDPHCYEISQMVFFTFIMVPKVHLNPSFLWE